MTIEHDYEGNTPEQWGFKNKEENPVEIIEDEFGHPLVKIRKVALARNNLVSDILYRLNALEELHGKR